MLITIFWILVSIVLYTYLGYALVIYFLAKFFPFKGVNTQDIDPNDYPTLTLCIAAYNEAEVIPIKMENNLSLCYPKEKLKIIWVIDGSNDNSEILLANYSDIEVLYRKERLGKTAAINHAMEVINSDIVVFTDANCLLSQDSLLIIAKEFEDDTIGCVAGEKRIEFYKEDGIASKGEGSYWLYESLLKRWDSIFYSAMGAAGELFAVRRTLFKPIPLDILLDDFMISMGILKQGYRIAYAPQAYAVERGSLNIEEEKKRKVRIAAGGWQSVWLLKSFLNVAKYGRLSFQYISHRVLRWTITPFALFLLLPLNIIIVLYSNGHLELIYILLLVFQLFFYTLSFIGFMSRHKEQVSKVFFIPFYFVFMNYNAIEGLYYLMNRPKTAVWEKSKRK